MKVVVVAKIITKPIVTIIGSRDIKFINFNLYLDKNNISQVISGGASGVDTLAEQWAKKNHLDFVAYLPNYRIYGEKAPLVRDREMVEAADHTIAFWNGKSTGTLYTIQYSLSLGHKTIVHLIEER